jgi:spermidine/putrescine-binding protein
MHEDEIAVYTTTDDQGYAKWKTNATGSFYAAQGHIMELVNAVTNDESDIAYLGWPGAEENGSIIWTHSVWIPKVAKNKDLAKMYIREVVFSKAMQQWSFNNYGKLPVMKDYYGEGIERFQDEMSTILSIADASSPIPLFADLQEYLDILQKYLPEAAFGRMGVEEALSKVQQETEDLDFSDLRAQ